MACLGGERSFETGPKSSLSKWLLERASGSFPGIGNSLQPTEAYFGSCPTQSVVFLGSV